MGAGATAWIGVGATATGAGAGATATGAGATGTATTTGAAGAGGMTEMGFGRRGNWMRGAPRQSFHVSVARGGTGGLPVNVTSKTPRFTSLPGGTRSSDERTSSSCVTSSVSPAASLVPCGTRYTYSRYVSGIDSVASCSRLKMICDATAPATSERATCEVGAAMGAGATPLTGGGAGAGAAGSTAATGPEPIITVRVGTAAAGAGFFGAGAAGGCDAPGLGGPDLWPGASSGALRTS